VEVKLFGSQKLESFFGMVLYYDILNVQIMDSGFVLKFQIILVVMKS
jgi:hypothetical protein